ncbi:hypothetical protein NNC19_02345 [Clostridium sp. SHJSY1]|uniref:hypothetical protein n=1 Tax=Clostridium sp. SHJSY1 TaxID=2942483 RepID=UPI002874AED6|nr:hypothetical protein [Clostridium sp. SHJSY1]MDS0524500.1 hypothetical protein [Clostridium sp. SHJSY1]
MKKKILKQLKDEMQLNYLGKEGALTGLYRDYSISMGTLDIRSDLSYIYIPVKPPEDFNLETLILFLNNLGGKFKGVSLATYENCKIVLNYSPSLRNKGKKEIFLEIINVVINFCTVNGFVRCCEFCGESDNIAPILINNIVSHSCVNCKTEIKSVIANNRQAQREKSSNIVGGIVGSFIGALVGSIIWIIIYQMGYIAAIAGLAIAVCSIVGYEKFGGKLDIVGIIITSLITIVAVYLAQYFSLSIEIYDAYKYEGFTFISALKSVPIFLENHNVSSVFWEDLIKGYALTIAGSVSYIHRAYKEKNYIVDVKDVNF